MLAFESAAKALQFLHNLAGIVCVAVCVHLLVRLWRSRKDQRIGTHARNLAIAYVVTFALGALIYPTFRVRTRAEFLDATLPWATALFEIKEHSATLALLPAIAIFFLSRELGKQARPSRAVLVLCSGLVGVVLCVLLFNACVGWYLGTLRSG